MISLQAHLNPVLQSAEAAISNSQFLLEQLADSSDLAKFNENLSSWGMKPIEDTIVNKALLKTLEEEFPKFKNNLTAYEVSVKIMQWLVNSFDSNEKEVAAQAEALNRHLAETDFDRSNLDAVLKDIATKWKACDFTDKDSAKSASEYAAAHTELDKVWPFRFKNLQTLTVLKKLNSTSAKAFATLYEAGGPAKVILTSIFSCFFSEYLTYFDLRLW